MKKTLLITLLAAGLVGCATTPRPAVATPSGLAPAKTATPPAPPAPPTKTKAAQKHSAGPRWFFPDLIPLVLMP